MTAIQDLPEGCIAAILSRTTQVDVGRLSVVSKTFRSAAESDAVWIRFLPSDEFVTHMSPSLFANAPTKKALYLALSDRPIIILRNHMSFQLDRKSGKWCYKLSARSLTFDWDDDDDDYQDWRWIPLPDSTFPEVAEAFDVRWLEIHGEINTVLLSPNTQYAAYVVFKMIDAQGFQNRPVELSVVVGGCQSSIKHVCLDPNVEGRPHKRVVGLQRPSVRRDGWLEIEMGEFFNSGKCEELQMNVMEIKGGSKSGLFLEGIEIRPK